MKAVVKLSSMGDVVHSLVVLPKLKEKVDFVIDASFKEVLEHSPFVKNVISVNLRKAKKNKKIFFEEYKKLKKLNYEIVYDLQGLIKSALVSKIIGKKIIGYENPREKLAAFFYDEKVYSKKKFAVQRYLELFGMDDDDYLRNHPKLLFYKDRDFDVLSSSRKNVVFIIGGSWECKKAPLNIWIKLADYLKNENIIVPYSSESEKKDAFFIAENSQNATPVKLNVNDLKALIDKSDLLIGNDTGPSFMAWANNVNNVILYGCTYNNKILENKFSKSVEAQRKEINKKLNAINDLKVEKIVEKINEF